jgi:acetylornithine deacetylase/succinyl-diaminopimelate desuccinylase-like protein
VPCPNWKEVKRRWLHAIWGAAPLDEVVRIAQDLIRFDTTNFGAGRSKSEDEAAQYVRALLAEVGLTCTLFEPEPGSVRPSAK